MPLFHSTDTAVTKVSVICWLLQTIVCLNSQQPSTPSTMVCYTVLNASLAVWQRAGVAPIIPVLQITAIH